MFSFFRSRKQADAALPAAPEADPGPAATVPAAAAVQVTAGAPATVIPPGADAGGGGWLQRLRSGLSKTRERLGAGLGGLFQPGGRVDEAWFEQLEDALLLADVGVSASRRLLQGLREAARREKISDAGALRDRLTRQLTELLQPLEREIALQDAPRP